MLWPAARHGALVDNNGLIDVSAAATAIAYSSSAQAEARATGVRQTAVAVGSPTTVDQIAVAHVTFANSVDATLEVDAFASAIAENSADATAIAWGVDQVAAGGTVASANVTNDGPIDVAAIANASGGDDATAFASARGIFQGGSNGDDAPAFVSNDGILNVLADASAEAGNAAVATASVWAVDQTVTGVSVASATIINSGIDRCRCRRDGCRGRWAALPTHPRVRGCSASRPSPIMLGRCR